MSDYKLLNHTRKRLICSRTTPRDFYAQSQLKETSMLKDNSKRLILTITKNWIRFEYLIYNQRYSQYNANRTDSVFLRHLRILRYKQLKEFSKLLMLCIRRLAQSVGLLLDNVLVIILQVFIPIYRGVERRWEFSRYINLSALKLWFFTLDPLPDLIVVLWRT